MSPHIDSQSAEAATGQEEMLFFRKKHANGTKAVAATRSTNSTPNVNAKEQSRDRITLDALEAELAKRLADDRDDRDDKELFAPRTPRSRPVLRDSSSPSRMISIQMNGRPKTPRRPRLQVQTASTLALDNSKSPRNGFGWRLRKGASREEISKSRKKNSATTPTPSPRTPTNRARPFLGKSPTKVAPSPRPTASSPTKKRRSCEPRTAFKPTNPQTNKTWLDVAVVAINAAKIDEEVTPAAVLDLDGGALSEADSSIRTDPEDEVLSGIEAEYVSEDAASSEDDRSYSSVELLFHWLTCSEVAERPMERVNPEGMIITAMSSGDDAFVVKPPKQASRNFT